MLVDLRALRCRHSGVVPIIVIVMLGSVVSSTQGSSVIHHSAQPANDDAQPAPRVPVSTTTGPLADASSDQPSSIPTPNGPGTPWIASGGVLPLGKSYSSVFLYNESFLVVGGCLDPNCRARSGSISRYDPLVEEVIPTGVADIPLFFTIPSPSPKLPPTFVRATFAGPTAVVPVASMVVSSKSVDTVVRPWLVGPCSLYFTFQGNSSQSEVTELYHGVWGFSIDISAIADFGKLPDGVPVRGNASCQAFGTRIFIIGGIYIDTLEPVDSIDAYDTQTMTYYPNVGRHVEAVMNPAVTIDNRMMYIVGGQRPSNCSTSSKYYLWTTPRRDVDIDTASLSSASSSSFAKETVLDFCQSSRATAYYFPSAFLLNESLPLKPFILPDMPDDIVVRHLSSSTAPSRPTVVAEMVRAYSFGGTLAVTSFTTVTSTLQVEDLIPELMWRADKLPPLLTPQWGLQKVPGLHVEQSALIMFPIPYVFYGVGLALFSFGGVIDTETLPEMPMMTQEIYQRFVGLSMPAQRGSAPLVEFVGSPFNISLQPPTAGYLRLADNSACVGNAAGTIEQYVNVSDDGSACVAFTPLFPCNKVYICYSFGNVYVDANITDVSFFTVINAFQPFSVVNGATSEPSPATLPPGGGSPSSLSLTAKILIGVFVPVFAIVVLAVGGRYTWRLYQHRRYDELPDGESDTASVNGRRGLLSDRLFNEDSKDRIIRQTTSDSRYKVLKRIGEGAFSSVYLVCPKRDATKTFAMKFMICADDRERLEAIKECETINSVQGHPSIIRLQDMFMNYEFGAERQGWSDFDENDRALLLTSSMHAISIQRSPGSPKPVVVPVGSSLQNERTPLTGPNTAAQPRQVQRRNTTPDASHTNDVLPAFPSVPTPEQQSVHRRYLCLVMEYHPSGDLCRYVLKRAVAIQQERDRQQAASDMLLCAKKKSSITSDDELRSSSLTGPPSTKTQSSSAKDTLSVPHALSEPQLLSIAYQIASVLQFLHSQRPPIVHRDLKPENILIRGPMPDAGDPFIPIVVTDFGLAFIQEEHRRSGRGGGTRPYISPESWKGQTTTASDVWGLGCVLYALATERLTSDNVRVMFQDAKFPKFTHSILSDLIRTHRYSAEFAVFVALVLEVDPKKRPTAEKLVKMFDVRSSTEGDSFREEGYISFKKDAFGPNGAPDLVPFECTLLAGSGLPISVESTNSAE